MAATTDRTEPKPRARKRFGQNFLEPAWARKVVTAIRPGADEVFLEIGPGPGAITTLLAGGCRGLLACEIDRVLAASLRARQMPGLRVLEGDFLKMPAEVLSRELQATTPDAARIRVAGNPPYNVASPIMFRLVDLHRRGLPIADATLMLQREVADRLLAEPGSRDYGVLTVLIRHRAAVERLLNLPPGAFRPAPKVHSSLIRLRFHGPEPPVTDESTLEALTTAVFSRRRKTLGNALLAFGGVTPATAAAALTLARIDPVRRPETLTIAEFATLADAVLAVRA